MRNKTILVVEDDPDIVDLVRYNLEREGFRTLIARDGERGVQEALRSKPGLVLLDLMLPGIDGLEVLRRIRARDELQSTPVLVLTAKGEDADVVVGLEIGADDYMTKPFSPRELIARIRAVMRRVGRGTFEEVRARVEVDGLVLDKTRHEATFEGELMPLTRAEFRLVWTMAQRPGRVYSRSELVDRITAGESLIIDRNVDVHISAIRKKLGRAGDVIQTVRGVGYRCKG